MLPSNLLIARKYGDTIRPVYAQLDKQTLELADRLIHTYQDYVGEKKQDLMEAVSQWEKTEHDYRFVRGLSTLLERRCQFRSQTKVDPLQARRTVFQLGAEKELPTREEARQQILEEAASKLEIRVEDLEHSLYGDLEGEQILKQFNPVRAYRLVRRYNLSLTQTLLFRSAEMGFTASGNWQPIFRQIKWLGLIYTIQKQGTGYWVRVDGPVSLFKLNRRYGTNLAKLLPHILCNTWWRIRAQILRRRDERRLLKLQLNSQRHAAYLPVQDPRVTAYHSSVEQDFAHRFQALKTGWQLTREPEPLPVGSRVMIPDFSFQKAGIKIYLEIAGFWTPSYLKHKLRQLSQVKVVDMIVAADKKLACQKLDHMARKLDLIYYERRVPLKPILAHLREREERLVKQQVQELRRRELRIEDPVVTCEELATRWGVLEEAVRRSLEEKPLEGYRMLGDLLIKPCTLDRIERELRKRSAQGELTLQETTVLIQNMGGRRPTIILEALGYGIQWQGINPEEAKIIKK